MANWVASFLSAHPDVAARPVVKRARHALHTLRPDGQVEAFFTGGSIHYQNGAAWEPIDTDLRDIGGGVLAGLGTPATVGVDGAVNHRGGGVSQKPARLVRYRPSTAAVTQMQNIPGTGTAIGETYVRSGAWGTYTVRIYEDGVKQELVLASLPAFPSNTLGTDYICIEEIVSGLTLPDGEITADYTVNGMTYPAPHASDANDAQAVTKRFAKTVTGVQYVYTGVPVAWLQSAAYPVTVDPDFVGDTADTRVQSWDATYATARSTSVIVGAPGEGVHVGQNLSSVYTTYRGYFKFDTSSLGTGVSVAQVNLKFVLTLNYAGAAFDVQIVKQDWSAQDPLSDANREAAYDNCLAGTADDSIWRNTSGASENTAYTSGNLSTAWVNKTSATYYSLRSSRDFDNIVPTGVEYVIVADAENATSTYRPVLIVVTGYPSGTSNFSSTEASISSAPYDDHDWTVKDMAKADDGVGDRVCPTTAASTGATGVNDTGVTTNAVAPYSGVEWDDKIGFNANDAATAGITSAAFDNNVVSYLAKLSGLGFAVPAGAVIDGVEVKIERTQTAGSCVDACVQLLNDSGALFGSNLADTTTAWTRTTYVVVTYGGPTNMWGLTTATLTPAIVNDADFGVGFAIKSTGANCDAFVDYVTVNVYYHTLDFDTNDQSYLLKFSGFGFAVPSDQTVDGIEVKIERYKAAGAALDACVQLLDETGTLAGDNKADTGTAWPASYTVATYGGATDKWGATLTPAIVNDADFGLGLAVKATSDDSDVYVDYVTMAVYYSAGGNAVDASGALTFVGIAQKQTARKVIGELTPGGALVKASPRTLTGAVTSAGIATKRTGKLPTGALASNGAIVKSTGKGLAGALTSAGALVKRTGRSLSGALTSSGSLAASWLVNKVIGGALTSVGTLSKQTGRALSGALTSTGSAVKATGRTLAGALTSTGATVKATARTLSGAMISAGSITKATARMLAGALASSGALIRRTALILSGALTSTGDLATRRVAFMLTGALTSAGSIAKKTARSLSGTLASAGDLILRRAAFALSGALTSSGSLIRTTAHNLAGDLASAGDIVTRRAALALSGALSFVGDLIAQKTGGAQQFTKDLAGALTSAGTLVKATALNMAGALTPAGALSKALGLALVGALTSAGTLGRTTARVLAGTLTSAGSVVNATARVLAGALSSAGNITKSTARTLAGNLTPSATLGKQAGRILSGALAFIGDLATFVTGGGPTFSQVLDGALTPAGTIVKATARTLTGSLASAGVTIKAIALYVAGALTPSGALGRLTEKVLAGALSSSGAVVRQIGKALAGALTSAGTLQRITARSLAGVLTSAGALSRSIGRVLSGALSFVGDLAAFVIGGVTFTQLLDGVLAPSGALVKATSKTLAGALTSTGSVIRSIGRVLLGALTFNGSLTPTYVMMWLAFVLSIRRGVEAVASVSRALTATTFLVRQQSGMTMVTRQQTDTASITRRVDAEVEL